jgi:polyisoprenyl-phosphate glycosyltransferase
LTSRPPIGRGTSDVVILVPVFDDWTAFELMLRDLDRVLQQEDMLADVLVVDDGSNSLQPEVLSSTDPKAIPRLDVLRLRRNVGHQRAIAIGLAFIHANRPCQAVVVMDADGEDRPSDVPRLLAQLQATDPSTIVFAERTRRSERYAFKVFYHLYRAIHRTLVGFGVRVGNFSAISFAALESLVAVAELWNHYAAAAFKARLPHVTVATTRAPRLAGSSRMRFVPLVLHGLSALSVFADTVGVRCLVAAVTLALMVVGAMVVGVAVALVGNAPIPRWTVLGAGIVLLLLLQIVMISLLLIFTTLNNRATLTFLPIRDFRHFVQRVDQVFPRGS